MKPVFLSTFNSSVETKDELVSALRSCGYAFARNVSFPTLQKVCALLGEFEPHPDADKETYFTDITADSSNLSYPDGSDGLPLHTDGSAVARVPNILVTYCVTPADKGGVSLFADTRAVYESLKANHPAVCTKLSTIPVIFGNPSLGQHEVPIFEVKEGEHVRFRFRDDGYLFYDKSLEAAVVLLKQILARYTFEVTLGAGDVYIIDNTRTAHGRTAFEGDRHVKRLLIHSTLV